MNRLTGYLLSSSLLFGCLGTIAAQENSGAHNPPKVLNILREFTKPGKAGMSHEKTESAFIKAMSEAKSPNITSGRRFPVRKPRSLFLTGFDSFEAWGKQTRRREKSCVHGGPRPRRRSVDGELLSDTDSAISPSREDLSLRPGASIARYMRYFEISLFHIKPGHDRGLGNARKKMYYQTAFEKMPDTHWATYEAV